jgi:hypothetical protein
MSFFKNLRAELGTGAGKGFNAVITSIWEIFSMFCGWLFRWQYREGEHPLHTNSFRIAVWSFILALIFMPGLVRCSFTPTTKPPLENKLAEEPIEVHPGQCVTMPPNVLTRIAVWSLPRSFENMRDLIYVKQPDGTEFTWSWTKATSGNYVADGSRQIIRTMGAEGGGELCF